MRKQTALLIVLFSLFLAKPASAILLFAPQACPVDDMILSANNLSKDPVEFWIQMHQGSSVQEKRIEMKADSKAIWKMSTYLHEGQAFFVKHFSAKLSFRLSCRGDFAFDDLTSASLFFTVGHGSASLRLLTQNLDPQSEVRNLKLRWLSVDGDVLKEEFISLGGSYSSQETSLTAPKDARKLKLEGDGRVSVRLFDGGGRGLMAHLAEPTEVPVDNAQHYFLLANDENNESYVVAIQDPKLVKQAQNLIQQKSYKITFANVAPAKTLSENRNFASSDVSPWSWKVQEVLGFSDLASDECAGSPSLVEEHFSGWMAQGEPLICFWSYRLKRELSPDEVRTGVLMPTAHESLQRSPAAMKSDAF